MKNIYVILTATNTKFAKMIRFVTREEYNHMAISLTEDFSNVYEFARQKLHTPLNGKLVKENIIRYTLCKNDEIKTKIYKIPLTNEQYKKVESIICTIQKDENYIYNLIAALSYPIIGGFHLYKTFTCVEFVAYVLSTIGYELKKKPYRYTPSELGKELEKNLYRVCDIREILTKENDIYYDFLKKDTFLKRTKDSYKYLNKLIFRIKKPKNYIEKREIVL